MSWRAAELIRLRAVKDSRRRRIRRCAASASFSRNQDDAGGTIAGPAPSARSPNLPRMMSMGSGRSYRWNARSRCRALPDPGKRRTAAPRRPAPLRREERGLAVSGSRVLSRRLRLSARRRLGSAVIEPKPIRRAGGAGSAFGHGSHAPLGQGTASLPLSSCCSCLLLLLVPADQHPARRRRPGIDDCERRLIDGTVFPSGDRRARSAARNRRRRSEGKNWGRSRRRGARRARQGERHRLLTAARLERNDQLGTARVLVVAAAAASPRRRRRRWLTLASTPAILR
jgi:hypothetical protein